MTQPTWKAIPWLPQYEVSDFGAVRRLVDGNGGAVPALMEMTAEVRGGYRRFALWNGKRQERWRAARLVLAVFVGEAPTSGHQAAHNDGCSTNDALSNLRWATPEANHADKWRHKTMPWGEGTYNAKLTLETADQIRLRARAGEAVRALAREFSVNRWTIKNIASGKSWRDKSQAMTA